MVLYSATAWYRLLKNSVLTAFSGDEYVDVDWLAERASVHVESRQPNGVPSPSAYPTHRHVMYA